MKEIKDKCEYFLARTPTEVTIICKGIAYVLSHYDLSEEVRKKLYKDLAIGSNVIHHRERVIELYESYKTIHKL